MKNKTRKQYLLAVLAFLVFYAVLLNLLVFFEKDQPGAHIHTIGEAIWYSLVTISTVGYGDVTPVTAGGHVIGIIFLLMSMGLLVALFGSVVSVLTSEGFPMLRLGFRRHSNWYYFAEFTPEADVLARDLLREDPDGVIIYGINEELEAEKPDYPCFFINVSPARIIAHKKGIGERCKLFFLEEDDIGRNLKAMNVRELDADVYARTTSGQEKMSGNLHFFHSYDCCARSYWRDHPLHIMEDIIVIIGFGNYGTALLERAILMNINDSDFDVSYHVFGDSRRFREMHVNLDTAMGINEIHPGHDSIFFHDEDWESAHDVIRNADRIIICDDIVENGWDIYWQIQRFYRNKGRIHLRSNIVFPGIECFGTNEQIFTVNQIVRTRLNDAARLMNDLYRRSVEESLDWDELNDRLKQSKIAAADHLIMKVRLLLNDRTVSDFDYKTFKAAYDSLLEAKKDPEKLDVLRRVEHARWVRFYAYNNWKYGKVRDIYRREGPMICEYEELTEDQKAYHDRAWDLIGELVKQLGDRRWSASPCGRGEQHEYREELESACEHVK
jgi:voltage-gated potassium channel Kch